LLKIGERSIAIGTQILAVETWVLAKKYQTTVRDCHENERISSKTPWLCRYRDTDTV
jgi:hypothetical protein